MAYARERFCSLLKQANISNPNADILDLMEVRMASQLIVCSSARNAAYLYNAAKLLPGASTIAHLFTELRLRANWPLHPGAEERLCSLLIAADEYGRVCMIKMLTHGSKEAAICKQLLPPAATEDVALVRGKVMALEITPAQYSTGHGPRRYEVLVMPRYGGSVADAPQLPVVALVRGGRRMVAALDFIHRHRVVHMDIKVRLHGRMMNKWPGWACRCKCR